jgi:hypothetical protein
VGLVEDVDTSAFTAGDVLYVSAVTAGILVKTAPTHPNIPQEIGTILVSDAAVGSVQVVARSMFNYATAVEAVEAESGLTFTGGLTLGGDLDLVGNDLLFTNFAISTAGGGMGIYDRAKTLYKPWYCTTLFANAIQPNTTTAAFRSRNANNSKINLQGYDNAGGWTTVAVITGGATQFFDIPYGGNITMLDQKMMQFGTYTDAQRPAAGTAGRWIFNTDDGMPNYDDGVNWRDINGNIT